MPKKPERGRPTLISIKILKKAKLKIKDKNDLIIINQSIKFLQGIHTGRMSLFLNEFY